jgi:cytochrome c biogenesis protein CcmG/thiol:disulfide interchange protein DsbE
MRPTRIAATLVALALAATACGRASTGAGASSPGETAGRARNATSAPLLPRDPAALPEFDLDRFHELLGQLRGVPVVVNVWASWCGPCKLEAPHLAAAARRFGDRIQFLGVDILDQRSSARAFIRSEGWDYPSLFDPAGAIRSGLGFVGQPDTVFFDRRGHRVGFSAGGTTYRAWQGPITGQALDSILTQLLSR